MHPIPNLSPKNIHSSICMIVNSPPQAKLPASWIGELPKRQNDFSNNTKAGNVNDSIIWNRTITLNGDHTLGFIVGIGDIHKGSSYPSLLNTNPPRLQLLLNLSLTLTNISLRHCSRPHRWRATILTSMDCCYSRCREKSRGVRN